MTHNTTPSYKKVDQRNRPCDLQDGFGTPMFYSFENYMTVLDTGFSSSFFMGLEQDDYNSVLSGIEMNYK